MFSDGRTGLDVEPVDLAGGWHSSDNLVDVVGLLVAGFRPQRRNTRAETDDTKSRAGRRAIGLPAELVVLLERHRDEQDKERITAA